MTAPHRRGYAGATDLVAHCAQSTGAAIASLLMLGADAPVVVFRPELHMQTTRLSSRSAVEAGPVAHCVPTPVPVAGLVPDAVFRPRRLRRWSFACGPGAVQRWRPGGALTTIAAPNGERRR